MIKFIYIKVLIINIKLVFEMMVEREKNYWIFDGR